MTKKEENQQSSSISFKIKLIKKEVPKPKSKGLYEQIKDPNRIAYSKIDMQDITKAFEEVFSEKLKQESQRTIKVFTNQAGMNEFEKALKEEVTKNIKKNEHRKKLDFRSKILKQTYKFR